MSAAEKNTKQDHYIALDLLRGVAAIAVLLLHWFEGTGSPWFGNGYLAVDFFFVLSGYVVSKAYEHKLKSGMKFSDFFVLRLIRLYPMVFIGIALGAICYVAKQTVTGTVDWIWLAKHVALNLFMLPDIYPNMDAPMFILNLALWSLLFEFIAYAVYGLFGFKLSLRMLILSAVIWGAGTLGWINILYKGNIPSVLFWETNNYVSAISRLLFAFTLGVIIRRMTLPECLTLKISPWVLSVLLFAFFATPRDQMSAGVAFGVVAVGFPLIILLCARPLDKLGMTGLAVLLGDISYPLYVVHTPVMWMADGLVRYVGLKLGVTGSPIMSLSGFAIVPVCICFSLAAFKYYDFPLRMYLTRQFRMYLSNCEILGS